MPLLPFRRPPAEPPAAALSPARAALQKNHDEASKQLARLDELAQPLRQLTVAQERLDAAQAAINAIEELDRAALAAWGAAPSGAMPAPIQRAAAVAELAEAQAAADAATRVWDVVSPGWRKEESALHQNSLARPRLVHEVLIEEATRAVERRRAAFIELAVSSGSVEAIIETFRKLNDGAGVSKVIELSRGGDRNAERAFHDAAIARGLKVREAYARLHRRLMTDATAEVEIDEPAAVNNGAAA